MSASVWHNPETTRYAQEKGEIVTADKRTIPRALKLNDDSHDFAESKCLFSQPFSFAIFEQVRIEFWLKDLAEVVNLAEQYYLIFSLILT